MWEKVKASNPSMGVCEISAAIGRMWRELGADEKQRHNDDYTLDKVGLVLHCYLVFCFFASNN
jgi:HMG (high mobility group) box